MGKWYKCRLYNQETIDTIIIQVGVVTSSNKTAFYKNFIYLMGFVFDRICFADDGSRTQVALSTLRGSDIFLKYFNSLPFVSSGNLK